MSDQLKKIAVERDAAAFKDLFLTFGPKVKAMLMRQGADTDTAEEIAQDTMLAVWNKSGQFAAARGSIATWIYTIARNLRIDRIRRQVVWQDYCGLHDVAPCSSETPDDMLIREQERVRVGTALTRLPPDQFQIIKLSFIEGLSQSEISEKLNLPLGTVKSRMRLAYEKLRGAVEEAQ
jgi:RNA polymerase sigma-70 factor (ECF subfamily)